MDDLNENNYIFKDSFGKHRIKVDESDMGDKYSNNLKILNHAISDYSKISKGISKEDAIEIESVEDNEEENSDH
jgi:hypothetical protein